MEQRFKANASKHSAVSYKRAEEQIDLLSKEVEDLMAKAEAGRQYSAWTMD